MKKLFLASLISFTSLFGAVVNDLEFRGLVRISPDVVSEMIGISKGSSADVEVIDKAIKKLYSQNYFEDIWVEDVGEGKLVFHIVEKPTIANIEVVGIGENDQDEIMGIIGIKKGQVYDKDKSKAAKLRLIKHYEQKGYFDTVVEESKEELSKSSLSLSFIINRGEEIFIQDIILCGAKNLEYSDIEPMIANKKPELLPWMWGFNDGKLRLSDLEYESERIKDVYMQNGYLDAVVSTPYLKAYMDSYTAELVYKIDEGKQYKINNIDITIPKEIISKKELLDEMALSKGQVFDINRLRQDIKKIKYAVADLGYAYVQVFPNIDNNQNKALTNITINIIPGEKVYINEVIISGNQRTIDRVARREVYLANGDLYSKTDLDDSIGALKRTSYFETVFIEEKKLSKNKINLVVHVKEASTGAVGGGIGYGSSDGLLLNANVSDSNIFGSGLKASVDVERSDNELTGTISLQNPRLFDSVYSLGGSLYSQDIERYDYDEEKVGFHISLGRKFGRYTSASLGYILETSQLSDLDPTLVLLGYSTEKNLKSAFVPTISFNNTDDYYLPRKGISASFSSEYAGIGGDEKFTKFTGKFSYFYGLKDIIDYDLILRYKAKGEYVIDNGYLPISEKIYLGGTRTLRGYESKSLSPKNNDGVLLGGNMMFANSIEASIPLIDRLKMRGSFFFDYGMTGEDDLDIIRASTGFNLEWNSPMGPVLLIFASPLMKEDDDRTSSFEFTMGRTF